VPGRRTTSAVGTHIPAERGPGVASIAAVEGESWPWDASTFAVEHADGPGTTLVVTTDQPHLSNWRGYEGKPILPSDVARAIEQALREGWTPTSRGATFPLDLSAGFVASP